MDDLPVIHLCLFGCGLVVNSAESPDSLLQFVQITAITQIQWHEQSNWLWTASHSLSPSQAMQIYLQTVIWATQFFQRGFSFFRNKKSNVINFNYRSDASWRVAFRGSEMLSWREKNGKKAVNLFIVGKLGRGNLASSESEYGHRLPPGIDNRPGDDEGHTKYSEGWAKAGPNVSFILPYGLQSPRRDTRCGDPGS